MGKKTEENCPFISSKAISTHYKPVNAINKLRQKRKIEFGVLPDKF